MSRIIRLFVPIVLCCLLCAGCVKAPLSDTALLMDTTCSITLYDSADPELLDACFAQIADDEQRWSRTLDDSEIALLNRDRRAVVSDDTAALLNTALSYTSLTNGALDITTAPLSDLWKAAEKQGSLPEKEDIDNALFLVGYDAVTVNGTTITLRGGTQLDLGAVAKGAAADNVAAFLKERGCEHALIDLGGNILAIGGKQDGTPFSIGIAHPLREGELIAKIAVTDMAVVTSGSYERGYTIGDTSYSHILDPSTGYPVDNDLLSVTVLCSSATTADCLSTACFVLGYERARALIDQTDDVEAVFVTQDGQVHATDGVTLVD